MTGYLLDTNTCIYALKGNEAVLRRLLSRQPSEVFVSVITECELRTGAAKSKAAAKTARAVESFLRPLQLLDFTSEDAAAYAKTRARLEKAGTPIGAMDLLIAAHGVARRLTVVTNNEREFGRVSGLRLENWSR